ncbi:hypothetical protein ASZ78_014010 [Callipepla squamata]|uniref:Acetylserotonin O-methyltransferase dimerisation domain-containing protein n=1 Tax=Callipepla squamata TaxID=9009 RepID=A0A226NFB3_CALSU|nr:hypothetical protein ASZ78_014010 [Callipepla squamata]
MVLSPVLGKLVSKRVVLASASPRRQEILTNVKHLRTPDVVIGADTIVTVDEQILEKPVDKQDAYRMLSRLNGKEHSVFTGVVIIHCSSKDNQLETEITDFYEETKVKFSDLSEELLWEYIHSGEPMDKAGGYGIQALGGMLVEYVHGDFLNVVGFPLNHFCKKLAELYCPPLKHTIQHIKHDSIPSVDTFECLSDGESESSSFKEHKGAKKLDSTGICPLGVICNSENSSGVRTRSMVPVENQNGVSDRTAKVPSNILDLMDGFRASKALFVACKLKIFDHLKKKSPLKAVDVANEIGTSVCGTERLLDACAALGLLEKTAQDQDLVAHYWQYEVISLQVLADSYKVLEQNWLQLFSSLKVIVIQIQQILTCHLMVNTHFMPTLSTLTTTFGLSLHTWSLLLKREAGRTIELLEGKRRIYLIVVCKNVCKCWQKRFDLSFFKLPTGCTGALAHELIQVYPNMKVTVFDLPEVIANASVFQPLEQCTAPVTFVSGDFFKDDLPEADLYILSRVLHDWSDEKIHVLLNKVSTVCRPGCGVLLAEAVLDDEKKKRSTALLQSLNMLVQTEGKERSGSEYQGLLEQHGFSNVKIKLTGNLLDVVLCIKV